MRTRSRSLLPALAAAVIGQAALGQDAVLAGRVFDHNGHPFGPAAVAASRWIQVAGKARVADSQSLQTDSGGSFLLSGLTHGSYTLNAWPVDDAGAVGGVQANLPSALSSRIELAPGAQVRDVRLKLRQGACFGVSGFATSRQTGERVADARLLLTPAAHQNLSSHSTRIRDGAFQFTNVEPGEYLLQTDPDDLTRDGVTGGFRRVGLFLRTPVVVGEQGVHDLKVQLGPGAGLTGAFKMAGGGPVPAGAALILLPVGGAGGPVPLRAVADGTFGLLRVQPGHYHLKITPPAGCYVISLRAGSHEIADVLDLTASDTGQLEILLHLNAGEIRGQTAADNATMVILWGHSGTVIRRTLPAADGTFVFGNLEPGTYRAIAVTDGGLIPLEDLETWRMLQAEATPLVVEEAERAVIRLPLHL